MPHISNSTRRIMLQRIPFLLATLGSLLPLTGLLDFDRHWVHSVSFIIIYSTVFCIELALFVLGQKLTTSELCVYSVMQISAFLIATIYFQDRYIAGKDTRQEFVSNMVGMVVAIVAEIYQVIEDCLSNIDSQDTMI